MKDLPTASLQLCIIFQPKLFSLGLTLNCGATSPVRIKRTRSVAHILIYATLRFTQVPKGPLCSFSFFAGLIRASVCDQSSSW